MRTHALILGISIYSLTVLHVVISLIGIVTGLIILYGMIGAHKMNSWTALFLIAGPDYCNRIQQVKRAAREALAAGKVSVGCLPYNKPARLPDIESGRELTASSATQFFIG